MQGLQCQKGLRWDDVLSDEQIKEWINIANQVNNTPALSIDRYVGDKTDSFDLVAFTDSSQNIYGAVLYLVNNTSRSVSFFSAKNRLVSKSLERKSIPSLELKAAELGVDQLIFTYNELTGENCVCPLKIERLHLYSDSLVALNCIQKHSVKFDKTNKMSVFVRNHVSRISHYCDTKPVTFHFCQGKQNPADLLTRPVSYRTVSKTDFFTGPSLTDLTEVEGDGFLSFTLPSLQISPNVVESRVSEVTVSSVPILYDVERSSSFKKVSSVFSIIFSFINRLKGKIRERQGRDYTTLEDVDIGEKAFIQVIKQDQSLHFPDIVSYFQNPSKRVRDIPTLVTQLNLFCDKDGILRVKCKLKRWKKVVTFPILLSKFSNLAKLLIHHIHHSISHGGLYSVLTELRKSYWIPSCFSFTKKCLKQCMICKRMNWRSVKLNQNSYRDFRLEPTQIPFVDVFLDYIGPFTIKIKNETSKCYLLIVPIMPMVESNKLADM